MAQLAQSDESTPLDSLPPEVIEALPEDIVEQLKSGAIDRIPTETLEGMRPDLADKVPDNLAEAAASNPGLTAVLIIIGLLSLAGAAWGFVKGFAKSAIILGLIAAVAWFFFFRDVS